MVESVAASSSIQEVNAALIAQMNAAQKASSAQTSLAGGAGFASELQAIEKRELPAPMPLSGVKTATATQAKEQAAAAQPSVSETTATDPSNETACADPKISRSARMACAEQATHVGYEDDDFGLDDLVDLVNPLQHLPVIGTIYRELTGDAIKPEVQVAGSLGFGLATGSLLVSAVTGIASALVEQSSGKEPLVQVADAMWGDKVETPSTLTESKVVLAAADTEPKQALAAPAQAMQAAQPADNAENAAQPAAASVAANAQQIKPKLAAATMPSTGGTRIGNVIHTSPMLRSAAKVSPVVVAANTTAPLTPASPTASSDATPLAKTSLDNVTLGTLIHEQAKAREAGQSLPPELVQDMMTMALDKYKAAHVASAYNAGDTTIQ